MTWASRLRAFCSAEPPAASILAIMSSVVTVSQRWSAARSSSSREEKCQWNVHVTTAVTLKGWRGRVYFAPVRLLHDAVTRSMMIAAARRLAI